MEHAGKDGGPAWWTRERRVSTEYDDASDCPVCMTAFDCTIQRPRTLPCGHTLCTPCIHGLGELGQILCPICRSLYPVPEEGFHVSYVIESLIRRSMASTSSYPRPVEYVEYTEEPAPSLVTGPDQNGSSGLSTIPTKHSMLQEQKHKVQTAISTCEEVQAQLNQYRTTLSIWVERQQTLENQLQELVDNSKHARALIQKEESQVVAKEKQVQLGEQQLHTLLNFLHTDPTEPEENKTNENVGHRTDEERQRAEECQKLFPDANIITTINKVRKASTAAVEAATTIQTTQERADAGDHDITADLIYSISDRFKALLEPTLEVEDLRIMTQPAKRLLQEGLVFAVQQTEGQKRHAKITLDAGRLYLHYLQDQSPHPGAVILQMDELVPAAPPCLVFLELQWPGNEPRRVFIRLKIDTPRARQFLMLCTGQQGPCYANTRLWEIWNKGLPGECVGGGDYETNNGTGGAALMSGLDDGEYRRLRHAGDVWGWSNSDPATGAQFCITTRDCQLPGILGVFGDVAGGLAVVAAAAQHSPIKEVTVVDCGMVLFK